MIKLKQDSNQCYFWFCFGMVMTSEELLVVIQQAKDNKSTGLILMNEGITKLPPEIGQLSNLQTIQ